MPSRSLSVVVIGLCAAARLASAQPARVTVRGVAWDSIRSLPLREAFIVIMPGASRSTTTDSRGRFHFDTVAPGTYTFAVMHAALDSLGFSGYSTKSKVTDGSEEVRIATPSFATLWKALCGSVAKQDSGFVYGTIRDAGTMAPVADAAIDITWTDFVAGRRRITPRNFTGNTKTDEHGNYTICGVPVDVVLRMHASHHAAESGFVEVPPAQTRIYRRDLLIAPSSGSDSVRLGAVAGLLTDVDGNGIPNARVSVDGAAEGRSDASGRFVVTGVPAGTRGVKILRVGADPIETIVDVAPRDIVHLGMQLGRVTKLETMRTTEQARRLFAAEFAERQRAGFGHMMDSTALVKYEHFVNVLRETPGLRVQYKSGALDVSVPDGHGGECPPEVRIDGAPAAFGHLVDLLPKEVAALEVYPRAGTVPMKFLGLGLAKPQCGMIIVWTKYGFLNR